MCSVITTEMRKTMTQQHKNEEPTVKVTVKVPFHLHYQTKLSFASTGQTFQKFLLCKLQEFMQNNADLHVSASTLIKKNGQSE